MAGHQERDAAVQEGDREVQESRQEEAAKERRFQTQLAVAVADQPAPSQPGLEVQPSDKRFESGNVRGR